MRAYIQIKMDRPVDLDKHYLSPGGYEVVIEGKSYGFDFIEATGSISDEDPTVVSFELRDEDRSTFPEIDEMREKIHLIMEFPECYIYTGERDDPEINCVKIVSFSIMDSGSGIKQSPESNGFVEIEHFQSKYDWCTIFHFTDKLLETIKL